MDLGFLGFRVDRGAWNGCEGGNEWGRQGREGRKEQDGEKKIRMYLDMKLLLALEWEEGD